MAHRNHDGGCRGGSRLSMGLSEDPCRPTSLASPLPTYLTSLALGPSPAPVSRYCTVQSPMHGARSTFSHGPRLPSLKPCYLLQRGEAPSSARQLHLPKLQESRLENLAAVPPPPSPSFTTTTTTTTPRQRHPIAAAGPDPPTQQQTASRQRRGLHGTVAVRFLSFGPGVSHIVRKRPYTRDLARSCRTLSYHFPNNAVLSVWQLANPALTLHTGSSLPHPMLQGPGHSRTALDPVLPPCRPARLSLFCFSLRLYLQYRAYRTDSYPQYVLVLSGAAACPGSPPWLVSMSSSPPCSHARPCCALGWPHTILTCSSF